MNGSLFSIILSLVLFSGLFLLWYFKVYKEKYQYDPILKTLSEIVKPITYDGKSIADGLKLYKGDKSFTINKTDTFLCLKDKEGFYYPINQLIYVLLHERAHSLNTKDVGHTPAFWELFEKLLKEAEELKIYNPDIPIMTDYCE